MKTKIIYISGNEIFDMADIRAAFEEVRNTLNLDKNTVLFGVPVDNDDAGLMASNETQVTEIPEITQSDIIPEEIVEQTQPTEDIEIIEDVITDDEVVEPEQVVEEPVKKRGRARKTKAESKNSDEKSEKANDIDEKIVPILSVLSSKEDSKNAENNDEEIIDTPAVDETDIEIIEDVVEVSTDNQEPVDIEPDVNQGNTESEEDSEPDLEKLLSAMKPLQEDMLDETVKPVPQETENKEEDDDDNIDATLEQLATEFVQTQDKIASESKSSGRGKIGKLRNILPFKQSKHKDQGLGDLFGWAGVAANDEDFSVPGFFTNASSKK